LLVLLLGCDARVAVSAYHELGEGELVALSHDVVSLHLLLHLVEELLGDNWLMLALIPVTALLGVLE